MDTAISNSVWVVSPEFSGFLLKRGFHWRKLWKKRWIALHGAEIAYMAEQPIPNAKEDLTLTKAQITSATIVDRDDVDGHPHGFAIHINDGTTPTWYLRAESTREKKSWLMRLGHVHTIVRWLEEFEKVRVLGVGGAGIVYELLHKTNGQRFAMKEMEIKNKGQMEMAVHEAEMLKEIMENINHPNIMHIEKVFQVGNKFYLVFPLCSGGELYEHIIRRGHFTEIDAANLMRDLISGLNVLHKNKILHLDIKPENILFETMADDARIKITDFGLSKEFVADNESSPSKKNAASPEELQIKLKAFQENGVLNRDRLRGTVGYMSPELILAGVSSEATDIWASGVVLYILLCGRPPFQSKSNRDILEKSARGDYSMEGKEWANVSEEAKDLVRKMLTVDPQQRITIPNILNHPWLRVDTADPSSSSNTTSPPSSTPSNSTAKPNGNLSSALRKLSDHVKDRKMEKMAKGFTRLLLSLQQGSSSSNKHRLSRLLLTDEEKTSEDNSPSLHDALLMAPEAREALTEAFKSFGDSTGRLSLENFRQILLHFGYGGENSAGGGNGGMNAISQHSGTALIHLCRIIDRDGDGYISPEDIFTTQAMLIQRSEQLLRPIFRAYIESVWYPGRHLNLMAGNVFGASPLRAVALGAKNIISDTGKSDSGDLVEPPKFITARHVAGVFEKLGYNSEVGIKIFNTLCEVLQQRKLKATETSYKEEAEEDLQQGDDEFDDVTSAYLQNDRLSEQQSTQSALEKTRSSLTSKSSVSSPSKVPHNSSGTPAAPSATSATLPTSPHVASGATSASGPAAASSLVDQGPDDGAVFHSNLDKDYKMDVEDFMQAAEIDDVMIQVLLMKPRKRIFKLFADEASTHAEGDGDADDKSSNGNVTASRGSEVVDAGANNGYYGNLDDDDEEGGGGTVQDFRRMSTNDRVMSEFGKALSKSTTF